MFVSTPMSIEEDSIEYLMLGQTEEPLATHSLFILLNKFTATVLSYTCSAERLA